MNQSRIFVADCESTGLSNHPVLLHPQIVSMGLIELQGTGLTSLESLSISNLTDMSLAALVDFFESLGTTIPTPKTMSETFYKPSMPIHPEASAIHGFYIEDLQDFPSSESFKLPTGTKYLIGFNIAYDYRCIGKPEGVELICLQRLSKALKKLHSAYEGVDKADNVLRQLIEAEPTLNDVQRSQILGYFLTGQHGALKDCYKNIIILSCLVRNWFTEFDGSFEVFYFQYKAILKLAKL